MHTACGHKKECAMKRNGLSSARVVTFEVTFNFKSAASRESFMETGKFNSLSKLDTRTPGTISSRISTFQRFCSRERGSFPFLHRR